MTADTDGWTEVDKFKAYLSDPQSKTDQHAAYADHYGQVVFVAKKEQERCERS